MFFDFLSSKKTPEEKLTAQFQRYAGKEVATYFDRGVDDLGHRYAKQMIDSKTRLIDKMRKAAAKADRGLILNIDGVATMLPDASLHQVDKWVVGNVEKDAKGIWRLGGQFKIS